MPGKVATTSGRAVFSHESNNAVIAANRLIKAGHEVWWNQNPPGLFVTTAPAAELQKLASELGVSFNQPPDAMAMGGAIKLRPLRIALADQYGGSMPSGWTRWLLEQYEFPFEVVFPAAVNAGNLASKYDVIIFPSGVGPRGAVAADAAVGAAAVAARGAAAEQQPAIPAEYQPMVGAYTAAQTVPALKQFAEAGGVVLAVGRSSMNLATLFDLPVSNHLVERSPDGTTRPIPSEKYYVPGSVLRMAVDTAAPIAHGITNPVDVFFDNSPVFRLDPDAQSKGVRPVAWFDSAKPLRSGWAYGQGYLEGGVQVARRVDRQGEAVSSSRRRSPSAHSRMGRSSSCSTASISPRARRPRRHRRRRSKNVRRGTCDVLRADVRTCHVRTCDVRAAPCPHPHPHKAERLQ